MTRRPLPPSLKDRVEQAIAFDPDAPINRIAEREGCTVAKVWAIAVELDRTQGHIDQPEPDFV